MAKYDMTIIGGGSGGLTAARLATALGASVLLIEKEQLGGDCLHYGCVPSKSMIHVARVVQQAKEAATLGLVPAGLGVDIVKVSAYIQSVIERVSEGEQIYTAGVDVRFGQVFFISATELSLNGETINSRNTLIATGSRPVAPRVEGLEETGYLTNEGVFNLAHLPASLVIIGGGPIGVELGRGSLSSPMLVLSKPAAVATKKWSLPGRATNYWTLKRTKSCWRWGVSRMLKG